MHPSLSSLCHVTSWAGQVGPAPLPALAERPGGEAGHTHRPRRMVKGPKGSTLSPVLSPSDVHGLSRAVPEGGLTSLPTLSPSLLSPIQMGTEWAPKDKPWHRALQVNTESPDLGCSTGRRDPLRSKMSDYVLRAHLAPGRVGTTSMPQPHRHPDTYQQRVRAGGLLPGTTHTQSSQDKAGARNLLNTRAGNQQVRAKRSRVQQSEAVRTPTGACPGSTICHRAQEEAYSSVGSRLSCFPVVYRDPRKLPYPPHPAG